MTIIGIIIGIAAIVSIISIGQGAQRTLEENLNSLDANIITVSPGFSRAMGAEAEFRSFGEGSPSQSSGSSTAKNLTVRDVTILKGITNVQQVMGVLTGNADVSFIGKTARTSIEGVDPAVWKSIATTDLASGRYLTQGDVNVAVVGGRIANSTFSGMEINRQISIGGQTFRIVGILKESGNSEDSRIFIPIQNAVTVLEDKSEKNFDSIIVKISNVSQADDVVVQITSRLKLSHGILQGQRQDFSVMSPVSMQQRVTATMSSMSIFLTAIAVISLIVGAIGIMNTMFTSVLEKTKDIGVLKALGAKNRDILAIFLLNSALIGFIGGMFGIIAGIIASGYIGQLSGTSTSAGGGFGRLLSSTYVSPTLVIEVFLFAIAVGLISGAMPAYRASKLKPVDALRYE